MECKVREEASHTFGSSLLPFADPLGKVEQEVGKDALAAAVVVAAVAFPGNGRASSSQHDIVEIAGVVLDTVVVESIFAVRCMEEAVD